MRVLKSIAEAREARSELRAAGRTLGLVPTMGALHSGHLALMRAALAQCDAVIASVFVNPIQFGPNEDLAQYPRTWDEDCRLLEQAGVGMVFAPSAATMYPAGAGVFVDVAEVSDRLDGASRPGHFRGVATVVAKLLNILTPERIFFGQKDAAQVAVLRKMVRELNFNVAFEVCPTVREPDGLAYSSRNRYLNGDERRRALILFRALNGIRERMQSGEHESRTLIAEGLRIVAEEPAVELNYLAIVNPDTLEDEPIAREGALAAIAAKVGKARLIDNLIL